MSARERCHAHERQSALLLDPKNAEIVATILEALARLDPENASVTRPIERRSGRLRAKLSEWEADWRRSGPCRCGFHNSCRILRAASGWIYRLYRDQPGVARVRRTSRHRPYHGQRAGARIVVREPQERKATWPLWPRKAGRRL